MSRFQDHLQIWSDGGYYEFVPELNNYVLTGACSKVMTLPHLDTALTSLGSGEFLQTMVWNRETHWPTFDALVDDINVEMKWTHEHLTRFYRGQNRPIAAAIYLGGFSTSRDRWEMYRAFIDSGGALQELQPQPETVISPVPTPEDCAAASLSFDGKHLKLNTELDMVLLMQAMRLHREAIDAGENPPIGHGLGCHVQRVVVRRNQVFSEIVHRWDDEVGKPITPKDGEVEAIMAKFAEKHE